MNRDIEARGLMWFHAGFGTWNSPPVAVALPRLPPCVRCCCRIPAQHNNWTERNPRLGLNNEFFRISVDMYLDNSCLQALQEAGWQQHLEFKGMIHPQIKSPRFLSWKFQSFGGSGRCTRLAALKAQSTATSLSFCMTQLLKITRRAKRMDARLAN